MQIHVKKDGEQYGPYTIEELRLYVQQGDFSEDDSACHDGENWVIIAEMPGFADEPVLTKPQALPQEDPPDQEPEPDQEEAVQVEGAPPVPVDDPPKKKKIIRWSIIGGTVALLAVGVLAWYFDSVESRTARDLAQGAADYFSKPIEVSADFHKGATIVASVTGEVSIIEQVSDDANASSQEPGYAKRAAKANDVLAPGATVHTGPDSEATLLFSNGALATVGPMSEVLIEAFVQKAFEGSDKKVGELLEEVSPSKMKLNLDFGELVVKIKKLKKESSMVIATPLGVAGVRGTQFRVLAKETSTTISVLSGSVVTLDLEKKVLVLTEETSVNLTMKTVAVEIALSAEDRARIESLNANAKEKTANFNLAELLGYFEQINPKLGLLENEIDGLGRSIAWGWQGRAPMPEPRHLYDGTVILEDKIYLMGGHAEGKSFNLLQRYDPETNQWATLAPMSKARRSLASTVLNGKIYVIGGYGTSSVEIYDPKSNSWSPGPSLPTSLDSATAITVNGKILLVGGRTSFQGKDQVLELDPATDQWTPKASLPMARNAAKLIHFQGKIWAIGGSAGTRVDLYDPVKDSWTEGAPLATARHWPVAWLANGKIFVAGGEPQGKSDVTTSKTIETYDFDAKKWISCGTLPEAKNGSAAIVFGRKVFLISGHHEAGPSVKVFSGIADPYPSPLPGDSESAAIFEREIRRQVKKPAGKLLPEDLASRRIFWLNQPKIRDLTPLSAINELEKLVLERNQVSDLSPLAQLTNLRQLSLISDSITDLSPLAGLTKLGSLRLGGMGIKDLSPLASLVNLTELRLEENGVTDFSFLQNLTKLQKLYLWGSEERIASQVAKIKEFLPQEKIVSFVVKASYRQVKELSKPIEWNWEKKAPVIKHKNVGDGIEVLDGKIYLIGNRGRGSVDSSAERYDPATDQWALINSLNVSRVEAAAVSLGGKIYAIGGRDENDTILSSVEIYDPNTDEWTMGTPLPLPIEWAHAHNFNGKILLFPGKGADGKILNQVFEFDPSTNKWTEKSPMGEERKGTYQFSSVEFQRRIWVLGGSDEVGRHYPEKNWVYIYDPATNTWESGPPMTTPRRISYAWVANGKIYNASGYRSRQSIESYDPFTRRWTSAGDLPGSKFWAGSVILDNKVYVVSGRTGHNFPTRDVYSADLSSLPSPLPGDPESAAIFEKEIREEMISSSIGALKNIPTEEMLRQDHLIINKYEIRDLTPLSVLENLKVLWLERNQVSDLSPLAGLVKLGELSMVSDAITDFSPLAKLTNLRRLRLGGEGIKDLSPLATLVNLTELRLEENEVTDFSFLQNLTKLQKLYLWGTAERVTAQVAKIKEYLPEEKIASFVVEGSTKGSEALDQPAMQIEWNWEKKASVLSWRNFLDGIETLDGKIYVIGGRTGRGIGQHGFPAKKGLEGNNVERYDPEADQWERIKDMTFSRHGAATAGMNGKIYAFGGKDDNGTVLATVESYDPKTNEWTLGTPLPSPIYGARAHALDGECLLFGGKGADEVNLSLVLAFDPSSNKWTKKAPMPEAREMFGTVAFEGKIWIMGGRVPVSLDTSRVDVYDPTTDTWTLGPPMTRPSLSGSCAWVSNGRIYSAGNSAARRTIECYDPATRRWSTAGNMWRHVFYCGSAILGEKVYIVSGRKARNVRTNSVYSAVLDGQAPTKKTSSTEAGVDDSLVDGLVAWWKFDETNGTVAQDSSGNGNNGALVAQGPTWVPGKIRGALSFDGMNDYVEVSPRKWKVENSASISMWFFLPKSPQGLYTVFSLARSRFSDEILFRVGNENSQFIFHKSRGNYAAVNNQTEILKWTHFVGVLNGGFSQNQMQTYLNGEAVAGSYGGKGTPTLLSDAADRKLRIGFRVNDSDFFAGLIDDVRLYDRVLSAAEVQALYQSEKTVAPVSASEPKAVELPDDGTIPQGHPILGVWQSRANPGAQRRPYRVEFLPDGRVMGNKQKYVDSNGAWTAKDVIKEKGMWIDNPNIKDDWPISESRISELIDETSVKWGRYVRYVMPNGLLKGGSTHSAVMRRVVDGKPIMRTKPAPYVEGLPSKTLLEFGKKNPEAPPWIVGIPRDHEILGMWKLFSAADDMIHKIEFLCDGHVVSSRESATDFGAGADEVIEIVDQRTVNIHTNGGARTYSVSPDDFLLDSKGVKIGARYVWPK